jgi:hypothetical protein
VEIITGSPIAAAERRNHHRFSLQLAVKCRQIAPPFTLGPNVLCETLNISSKGLVFATREAFQPGQLVEASIDWPIRLNGRVGLTLVVEGEIVRKTRDHAAMRIAKYEFKTRAAQDPGEGGDRALRYRARRVFSLSKTSAA